MGLIPVDRENKDHQALKLAKEYLDNNMVIGIFPEGTTEKEGHILPFKIGAVKMARDTNTKIVPFVIKGKYKILGSNLQIRYLKPIQVKQDLEQENTNLRDIIVKEAINNS